MSDAVRVNGPSAVVATAPWSEFLAWREDIAEAVFPRLEHPRLAFLDIEGDALAVIAERREMPADAVVPALVEAVVAVSDKRHRRAAFERIARETRSWLDGDPLVPPPGLPLLAVFSLAAERMAYGDGLAAHNYYGQLAKILNMERDAAAESYRSVAEDLWNSLDRWLRYQGGSRGRPVPFVIGGHRHIGRAMAQAVIRDADRRRLELFFLDFDLSPHSEMSAEQLEPLLNSWLENARQSPGHLRRLWAQDDIRPHIVEAVISTLEAWDGRVSDSAESARAAGRVRLSMAERRLVGGINLGVVLTLPRSDEARSARLHAESGTVDVALVPGRPGEMLITDLKYQVAPETLVGADFRLDDPVAGVVQRRPRAVVVLRQDDLTGVWHEVSQVKLGDPVCLLVKNDFELGGLIQEISGTSWTIHTADETPGLPEGWRLVRGITITGRPSRDLGSLDDLNALIPITRGTLSLSGGIRIPRAGVRTYHCDAPPTVTAAAGGEPFKVKLMDLFEPTRINEVQDPWTSTDGAPLAVDLGDLELDPGPYGVLLVSEGTPQEIRFDLHRSGDDELASEYRPLTHDLARPLAAMCAETETSDHELPVRGVPFFTADSVRPLDVAGSPPALPWWRRDRAYESRPAIRLPMPDANSCLYTGAHVESIESARLGDDGHARGRSLGVCRGCGRTRYYQNSYWKNHRAWVRRQTEESGQRAVPTLMVGRERDLGSALDWDLLVDVLVSLGGGDARLLRQLTKQVDPSARFFHEFVTTMETLGHLEILRDPQTMEVTDWETALPSIIAGEDRRVLCGHWTSSALKELRKSGIHVFREPRTGAPSAIVTPASVAALREAVPNAVVAENPGETLAAALPPLSAVMADLALVDPPEALKVDRYEPARDVWVPVGHLDAPGAYRTGGYARTYVVRTAEDVSKGSARRVNVALAKHLAALLSPGGSRPLLAYNPADGALVAPLGAPLPGLYGRAAVLNSGDVPRRRDVRDRGSFLVYPNISPAVASHLYSLIGA